jgi:hypothetical protein
MSDAEKIALLREALAATLKVLHQTNVSKKSVADQARDALRRTAPQ